MEDCRWRGQSGSGMCWGRRIFEICFIYRRPSLLPPCTHLPSEEEKIPLLDARPAYAIHSTPSPFICRPTNASRVTRDGWEGRGEKCTLTTGGEGKTCALSVWMHFPSR